MFLRTAERPFMSTPINCEPTPTNGQRKVPAMPITSRTAALLGWIGVAVFATGSIVAAVAYHGTTGEPYSPLNHYVSELGARKSGGLNVLFNAGLVIAALCLLAFLLEAG